MKYSERLLGRAIERGKIIEADRIESAGWCGLLRTVVIPSPDGFHSGLTTADEITGHIFSHRRLIDIPAVNVNAQYLSSGLAGAMGIKDNYLTDAYYVEIVSGGWIKIRIAKLVNMLMDIELVTQQDNDQANAISDLIFGFGSFKNPVEIERNGRFLNVELTVTGYAPYFEILV